MQLNEIRTHLSSVLNGGDLLLIVPPVVTSRIPILGPHILQAIAREQGYQAEMLYLNLLLASMIEVETYESLSYGQPFRAIGERLFARSAYNLPPLGNSPELCLDPIRSIFGASQSYPFDEFEYKYYTTGDFDLDHLRAIEAHCYDLIEIVSQAIAAQNYRLVGCSTNWEQTNCCIALLNRVKKLCPDTLTLIGGSNCEAEMAEGIASLSSSVDYIFSGESDETFAAFLRSWTSGKLPEQLIITGTPVEDLAQIPLPQYESYFTQYQTFFGRPASKYIQLGYESSRGCWWGQCAFCGMNGKRQRFREKSAELVFKEVQQLSSRYPDRRIMMIDKVMPRSYQQDLLPRLAEQEQAPPLTYEQRPGLSLAELCRLKQARVNIIKVGIEALSSGLLRCINKGVSVRQNLLLLRHARSLGLYVAWNLLWGFPGDKAEYYEETLTLLPLLRHLQPPDVFRHLSLDRFCPYVEQAHMYQVRNVRPWNVYFQVYPPYADVQKLAYRFIGEYPCEAHEHPELIQAIAQEVARWKTCWQTARLVLFAFDDSYIIHDSRAIDGEAYTYSIEDWQARKIMVQQEYTASSETLQWALERKLGVILDGWYVPLITAPPKLLTGFRPEQAKFFRNSCL